MKILIAGASGGIGRYLADHLTNDHKVLGSYNSRVPEDNLTYQMTKVDITNEQEALEWVTSSCSSDDELALVYCVGVNYNCLIHKSDSNRWGEVIESNLIGVQHILKYILPIMRKKRLGRVILLSSVVPQIGVPGTSAYSASKAALWGLTKVVAKENAEYGITINTINLGYFDTGMIRDVPEGILDNIVESIPQKKLGDPVNILYAVQFLLKSDYITGSQIDLNGGLI